MKTARQLLLLLVSAGCATAVAQTGSSGVSATPTSESGTSTEQLQPRTQNGVTYLCGGVGQEEVASLKGAARDYDLMLTFAAHSGAYLADVNVDIQNARGTSLLNTRCDGPIMLVDLPDDGRYRVQAEVGGTTLSRNATVRDASGVQRLALSWPTPVVDMGLTPAARGTGAETASGGTEATGSGKAVSGTR